MIEVYKVDGDIENPELVELFETHQVEEAKRYADTAFEETGCEHFFDIPKDAPDAGLRYWASDIPF